MTETATTMKEAAASGTAARSVLVVDDDEDLARSMVQRLEAEGIRAEPVLDGRSALRAIRRARFDLAILDLRLPDGSGFALLDEMLVHCGDRCPLVFVLTGDPDRTIETRAEHLGVLRVFRKPHSHRDIVEATCDLFDCLDGYRSSWTP